MTPARRALIAGLGLIGGSIGLALRACGWSVDFVDPAVGEREAVERGAAERKLDELPPRPAHDLVILATPVDVAVRLLAGLDPGVLVTTVGSVMGPIARAAHPRCLPGHPLAGSQERSLAAAHADLFRGKPWFLAGTRDEPAIAEMIDACGGRLERVEPDEHDAMLALTSHLPQLLSTALAAVLDDDPRFVRYAGSGLRTFLRLAGSDGDVWRPVLEANRENVGPDLERVFALARRILDGDDGDAFAKARRFLGALGNADSRS